MQVTVEDLRGMERLHVRAWPASETAEIDGWLWRYSGGGSQRANSVSTVDFTGDDVTAALDEVEARYEVKGAPARVHTYGASAPMNVVDLLSARGYGNGDSTLTMVKPVEHAIPPSDIEVFDRATDEWREVYLGVITENRRAVNARILETIPTPRAFFACRRGGNIISTALGVADGGRAVVECMATRLESRRNGGAQAVLRALECWAAEKGVRMLGLQVVATNAPAVALYRGLGFAAVATNRFWVRY
jgi:GNAT superfamily N-acetyltransferase